MSPVRTPETLEQSRERIDAEAAERNSRSAFHIQKDVNGIPVRDATGSLIRIPDTPEYLAEQKQKIEAAKARVDAERTPPVIAEPDNPVTALEQRIAALEAALVAAQS
jgi:hypothetical protein